MTNTPQVITAIITDTHIGSNTAIMSDYVVNSDKQQVFASPAQKWVLEAWGDYWLYIKELCGIRGKHRKNK